MAQQDHFLKLDGIDGESQDSKFKNYIDIDSFSFAATQQGTAATGGGMGKGRVVLGDFSVVKKLDKSSPVTFQYCCSGQPISKITMTSRKAGKDQQPYYIVTMTDCIVSSHTTGNTINWGDSPADSQAIHIDWTPNETVTFNYSTISVSYAEQDATGATKGPIVKGWDAKGNKTT